MSDTPEAVDRVERTTAIEDAFVTHWSNFGKWSRGRLVESDGVLWFENPIPFLPYNMVMRSRISDDADADEVISRVVAGFKERAVPYLWMRRPSDTPADLGERLERTGLAHVETATGMDLELDGWQPEVTNGADVSVVTADYDEEVLRDYIELIRTYWSVPESAKHLLDEMNHDLAGDNAPGFRLVAYLDGKPIGKLFANTTEMPARVAIYGVAVRPEARGKGVATRLMAEALSRAVEGGARRCVLHSSTMAISLYRRMGFVERCEFHVYATGPLFDTHHH